jgi:hypothetical protein
MTELENVSKIATNPLMGDSKGGKRDKENKLYKRA